MEATVRRIGNSLGIIIPKSLLDAWKVGEGDRLRLSAEGVFPRRHDDLHEALDEIKRNLAAAVASRFTPRRIRAHSLANLHRWKKAGAWVPAYDEWRRLMESADDGALFAVMLGRDERATRLRQSPPYVGLLPREEVRRINEEAAR